MSSKPSCRILNRHPPVEHLRQSVTPRVLSTSYVSQRHPPVDLLRQSPTPSCRPLTSVSDTLPPNIYVSQRHPPVEYLRHSAATPSCRIFTSASKRHSPVDLTLSLSHQLIPSCRPLTSVSDTLLSTSYVSQGRPPAEHLRQSGTPSCRTVTSIRDTLLSNIYVIQRRHPPVKYLRQSVSRPSCRSYLHYQSATDTDPPVPQNVQSVSQ